MDDIVEVHRNDDCIVCGKKGSAVLCDSCTKQYKERKKMLVRNYRVMTGTTLHTEYHVETVNSRRLEDDQLFSMLFVVDPENDSEIYGPFFGSPEAQRWCDNLNKLFLELRREIGDKLLLGG